MGIYNYVNMYCVPLRIYGMNDDYRRSGIVYYFMPKECMGSNNSMTMLY